MKLNSLSVYKSYDNTVYGSMTVEGEVGEVRLKLNHEQCQRIIAVVADTLVESAKELSQNLLAQTIDFSMSKQIEE
jgi:hypothetical protein